jgi:hypothetical protein
MQKENVGEAAADADNEGDEMDERRGAEEDDDYEDGAGDFFYR